MARIYRHGEHVTLRHALNVWRQYSARHEQDEELTDEIFAIALYSGEPTDADISPEDARDLISYCGIAIIT